MEDLKKIQEFFSKPLNEYSDENYDSLDEAKKEDPIDIITMDVPLFIRALEYAKEDAQEDMDLHDFAERAIEATKKQGILQMDDYDMLVGDLKQLSEGAVEIMDAYNDILDLVKKHSRKLNDDDAYALGLKLRAWFEKNIIKESYDEPFVDPNKPEKSPGQKYDKNKFANLMGRKVVYSGIPGTIVYADENMLKLKDKEGNTRKINYNMFTNQGFIKEIFSNL
jgi:hypothetical protein